VNLGLPGVSVSKIPSMIVVRVTRGNVQLLANQRFSQR